MYLQDQPHGAGSGADPALDPLQLAKDASAALGAVKDARKKRKASKEAENGDLDFGRHPDLYSIVVQPMHHTCACVYMHCFL